MQQMLLKILINVMLIHAKKKVCTFLQKTNAVTKKWVFNMLWQLKYYINITLKYSSVLDNSK